MDRDDENAGMSVGGSILRAVGTEMLIAALGFAVKVVSAGAAMAAGDVMAAALAGIVGTVAMAGAARADRACRGPEDAEPEETCQVAVCPASPGKAVGVAKAEISERCEPRFAARLDGQRGQGAGRGS